MKVEPYKDTASGEIVGYRFQCPGCNDEHRLAVAPHKNSFGASWSFNGNTAAPTFSPSFLQRVGPFPPDCNPANLNSDRLLICHSFIRDGRIQFLGDCTHKLAGQTVELPDLVA